MKEKKTTIKTRTLALLEAERGRWGHSVCPPVSWVCRQVAKPGSRKAVHAVYQELVGEGQLIQPWGRGNGYVWARG